MVVAVQKGLNNIGNSLRELGYEVVTVGEYHYPIDAVVYTGHEVNYTQITNSNIPSQYGGKGYGVLMVNATNKTISEIEQILKNRVYGSLI